ncbi:MAG: GntR family transcriptional regulator [Alphaproteobacteria bacterium]
MPTKLPWREPPDGVPDVIGTTPRSALADPGPRNGTMSASARVYEALRRQIIGLDLAPDAILDRAEIADAFKVSQSPVREAILRLEQDGLVLSFPQSRTIVSRIDVDRIREEQFLRLSVESEVVRQLAESGEPQTLVKAKGLLRMQQALVGDVEQIELFRQLDDSFHETLFAGVGQISLHRHIVSRSGHLARLRLLELPKKGKMRAVLDAHQAIVDAIFTGDATAAAEAMRRHLSGTISRIEELRQEHPAFFS